MSPWKTGLLAIVFGLALQGAARADGDLMGFGIEDPARAQEFRDELEAIVDPNGATRGDDKAEDLTASALLQEAYRTDPEATLDLIERMLRAGQNR